MDVAEAAMASVADDRSLMREDEVGELFAALLVEHHGSRRHLNHNVRGRVSVLFLAAARFSVARGPPRVVLEVDQRPHPLVALEPPVAALPAVAACGSAERTIFLTQERDGAVAALAGVHEHPRLIDKLPHGEIGRA